MSAIPCSAAATVLAVGAFTTKHPHCTVSIVQLAANIVTQEDPAGIKPLGHLSCMLSLPNVR